jgi:glycerol-3-phosphate cytidylyltransferase
MTSGVFDLFHIGHLRILKDSKALGDKLVVGVVSDAGAEAYKGQKPIIPIAQRMEIIRGLGFVDQVFFQETTDPTEIIEIVKPDVFTHGDDWKELLQGQDTIKGMGIEFVLLPYTGEVSSTKIKEKIKNADL